MMHILKTLCAFVALVATAPLSAGPELEADIVILGEVHDNPAHHATQARWAARVAPKAIVFEMLTDAQAARAEPGLRGDKDALGRALGWKESGWPDFAMYYPIFAAAPGAAIYGGAVPRGIARTAMQEGIVRIFGPDAEVYGLTTPLPEDQQQTREALQKAAHCNALPDHLLPAMVDVQRLRDATLARAALRALDETGGPVVVITGNGHARADWGVPAVLSLVRPDVIAFSLGQTEGAPIAGQFDMLLSAPPVAREDPCAAFSKD